MRFLAVLAAMGVLLGCHRRAGATVLRHRRIVAWYWAPAAALLTAFWVQVPKDLPLAVLLAVSGAVLTSMWVAELIQPSITVRAPIPAQRSATTAAPAGERISQP